MYDLLLIDGDILVYKCAFSVESVSSYFSENGQRTLISNIKEARERQGNAEIVKETIISPFYLAKSNLDNKIKSMVSELSFKDYVIVLSNDKKEVNKRNKIAKQLPYKVDRPPKPFHYKALRDYIQLAYNSVVVEEGEADDYLGENQTDRTIIASIDKDLLQIPGSHFNLDDHTITNVTELGELSLNEANKLSGNGFKWFCAQCLLGDRVDAIQGIPYLRQTKVYQILVGAKTPEECWKRVENEYLTHQKVPMYFLKTEESEESARLRYLKEIAQLIWIAHSKDDYYRPMIQGKHIV